MYKRIDSSRQPQKAGDDENRVDMSSALMRSPRCFAVYAVPLCLLVGILFTVPAPADSFSSRLLGVPSLIKGKGKGKVKSTLIYPLLWAATKDNENVTKTYGPIFDFADPCQKAVEKFERIDDAIMGGISLSSLKQSENESFARWSGICRLDGG